ncbi:hypothetical protein [Actinoplanes subtropicus]|uniref:hypothetical protein n=1 Tax=Actinoplanes subtropicus TaxID=543632 RepID=UPI0004C2D1CF|nr:hypothetical protein [Actinoplanes subtropicus]
MSGAHTSRFAVRDRGLRRVRAVTVWSAAGSAGLAVATAIALVPPAAAPASDRAATGGAPAGTAPPSPSGGRAAPDDEAGTARPHARRTTRTPRLRPPTTPPVPVGNGGQQATSGGS